MTKDYIQNSRPFGGPDNPTLEDVRNLLSSKGKHLEILYEKFRKLLLICGHDSRDDSYYAIWGDQAAISIISRHFKLQLLIAHDRNPGRVEQTQWPYVSISNDSVDTAADQRYIVLRRKSKQAHYDIFGWTPICLKGDNTGRGKSVYYAY